MAGLGSLKSEISGFCKWCKLRFLRNSRRSSSPQWSRVGDISTTLIGGFHYHSRGTDEFHLKRISRIPIGFYYPLSNFTPILRLANLHTLPSRSYKRRLSNDPLITKASPYSPTVMWKTPRTVSASMEFDKRVRSRCLIH